VETDDVATVVDCCCYPAGASASTLARVTFAVTVIASDYLDIESTGARKAKSSDVDTI